MNAIYVKWCVVSSIMEAMSLCFIMVKKNALRNEILYFLQPEPHLQPRYITVVRKVIIMFICYQGQILFHY